MSVTAEELRSAIIRSLIDQGYELAEGLIVPPTGSKESLRSLHRLAVEKRLEDAKRRLWRHEDRLLKNFADGSEVDPLRVSPRLVQVFPRSKEELLFRYATLQWSIPVSPGYGRRLRFLVVDQSNGKLMGLFGICDPVFAMKARDEWIGWSSEKRNENLYHVMNAYVLGAVPPYSNLLCGKLIALLLLSNEVREAFNKRYADVKSRIEGKVREPHLALVTTTSAFGRSSIYNRLRSGGVEYWRSIGFTQGTGEFHFSNGIYSKMREFAVENCIPTMKNARWGEGFRNKREIVRSCLGKIGLSQQLLKHGVKREIFAAPLGSSALDFLRGDAVNGPEPYDWDAQYLTEIFMKRWFFARANRCDSFRHFESSELRLWDPWGPRPKPVRSET